MLVQQQGGQKYIRVRRVPDLFPSVESLVDKCNIRKDIRSREEFSCIIVGSVTGFLELNERIGNDYQVACQRRLDQGLCWSRPVIDVAASELLTHVFHVRMPKSAANPIS